MEGNKNEMKARSRSRSRNRCNERSTGRSSAKKNTKDSLPPDVPAECSHLPPPPYRPAGPFALFFAANLATVDAKEVTLQWLLTRDDWHAAIGWVRLVWVLHVGWCSRRNHPCQLWCRSVQGVLFLRGLKIWIFQWQGLSPLQTVSSLPWCSAHCYLLTLQLTLFVSIWWTKLTLLSA